LAQRQSGSIGGFPPPEIKNNYYHINLLTYYEQRYILEGMIERIVQEDARRDGPATRNKRDPARQAHRGPDVYGAAEQTGAKRYIRLRHGYGGRGGRSPASRRQSWIGHKEHSAEMPQPKAMMLIFSP
jgi:hypothetical protein